MRANNYKDLRGQRFGRLVVLDDEPLKRPPSTGLVWNCLCDCGNFVPVRSDKLLGKKQKTRSCGCLHRESAIIKIRSPKAVEAQRKAVTKYDDQCIQRIREIYKYTAKHKGQQFSLSYDEFKDLVIQPCAYCGSPGKLVTKRGHTTKVLVNGIDRIDNNRGYVEGNCNPCCTPCNLEKKHWTVDMIYKYFPQLKPTVVSSEAMLYM